MSIWDHVKPSKKQPSVVALQLAEQGRTLQLQWDDGARTSAPARALRQLCPCAQCVDEFSGKRTLDPESVPESVHILSSAPVGNYGVSLQFSDGHNTGIYTWTHLRERSAPTGG